MSDTCQDFGSCEQQYIQDERYSLRRVQAVRYVAPLREGGSLPDLIEADDGALYVVKMRGAGQGPLALVAEVITGEIARTLGLRVPDLVLMQFDPLFGRQERDTEIRDLLRASVGTNQTTKQIRIAQTSLQNPLIVICSLE
jgi:hypothetical protein